tara:strand:+ start:309 stop:1061 length:753 start_codon:yes stop_codon:yes gene_type:complete
MLRCSLFAVIVGLASAEDYPKEKSVVVLDPKNFDGFIKSQSYTLVEFYAPWCGHCKTLEPEWAAAAAKVSKLKPAVLLAKVDADAHGELAKKYDVSGYPTIKIFKDGKAEDYDGPREAKGIVSFVKEAIGLTGGASSIERLKDADEAKAVTTSGYSVVGLFREPVKASSIYKTFTEAASEVSFFTDEKVAVKYSASYAKDPVAEALGVKTVPAILVYKPGKAEPASMPIPRDRKQFTTELLEEWLQKQLK